MCPASTESRRTRANGYTLLELLVVLSILLLIVAAIPTVGTGIVAGARFQEHGDAILDAARQSKYRARTSGQPQRFSLAQVRSRLNELPDEYSVALDGNIVFFPNGAATGGVVRLSAAGRTMEVHVDGITGSIERRTP